MQNVERESLNIFESPNLRHWPGGDWNISPFLLNIASTFCLNFLPISISQTKTLFFCIGVKIYYFSKKGPHCWFNMKICNIGRKLILIWSQLQMSMFLGTPKSDYVIYFWPFECAHYLNDTIRKISLQGPNLLLFSGYLEISIIITVNTNMIIIINTNLKCLL